MSNHGAFGDDRFGLIAEKTARFFGTPRYILGQTLIVALWIVLNSIALIHHWDPIEATPETRFAPERLWASLYRLPRISAAIADVVFPFVAETTAARLEAAQRGGRSRRRREGTEVAPAEGTPAAASLEGVTSPLSGRAAPSGGGTLPACDLCCAWIHGSAARANPRGNMKGTPSCGLTNQPTATCARTLLLHET